MPALPVGTISPDTMTPQPQSALTTCRTEGTGASERCKLPYSLNVLGLRDQLTLLTSLSIPSLPGVTSPVHDPPASWAVRAQMGKGVCS